MGEVPLHAYPEDPSEVLGAGHYRGTSLIRNGSDKKEAFFRRFFSYLR